VAFILIISLSTINSRKQTDKSDLAQIWKISIHDFKYYWLVIQLSVMCRILVSFENFSVTCTWCLPVHLIYAKLMKTTKNTITPSYVEENTFHFQCSFCKRFVPISVSYILYWSVDCSSWHGKSGWLVNRAYILQTLFSIIKSS